jgi:hypothetical protein
MTENIRSQTAAVIPAYQDEKHIGDIAQQLASGWITFLLLMTVQPIERTTAREAGAEVIVHAQTKAKAKQLKPGWRAGLALQFFSSGQNAPSWVIAWFGWSTSSRDRSIFAGNLGDTTTFSLAAAWGRCPHAAVRRVVNHEQ